MEMNRLLGKYVLNSTYSLSLSVAVTKRTGSYVDDYKKINLEMRRGRTVRWLWFISTEIAWDKELWSLWPIERII